MRWLITSLLTVAIIAGCEKKQEILPPVPLLDESTYLEMMIEMKLFNAMIQSSDTVVVADSLKGDIFDYYGVPEEVFLANHTYYQSFPEAQKERIDSALKIIERTLDSLDSEPQNLLQLQMRQ